MTILTFIIVVVAFVDTMALLPILSPFAVSLGARSIMVGLILGTYSLVNMVGNVIAGPIIDRRGRRATIRFGMVVAGVSLAAYALVTAPWQLLILRALHGAGGAILVPATFAHAGDRSSSGRVGLSMGVAGAAVATAALIGPAIGGIGHVALGFRPVFAGVGMLLVIVALTLVRSVDDPSIVARGASARNAGTNSPTKSDAIPTALRNPTLQYAYFSVFALTFAMGTLAYAFPLTMAEIGLSSVHTGALFSLFAAAAILVLVLPTNRLSDRYGRRPLAIAGSIAVGLALAGVAVADNRATLSAAMVVYGIGYGTLFPACCALVVDETTPTDRGTAFGLFYAVFSLGVVIGPVVTGVVAGTFSPYLIAIAIIVAIRAILAAPRYSRREMVTVEGSS